MYTKKPLLEPQTQAGMSTADVLGQLEAPEWRTRYRARADLQARPQAEVLAEAKAWVARKASAPAIDRLKT